MNTRVNRTCIQRKKRSIKICFFTSLASIFLFSVFSVMVSTIPGTFAWFTSETEAKGVIQNATTDDLLMIQASDVTYGENCSVSNALTIKSISDLDTTVRVSVLSNKGEVILKEQHLHSNETLSTNPEDISVILANECGTDHIEYQIHAFINFVDQSFVVAVDPKKMIETIPPTVESINNDDSNKNLEEFVQDDQSQILSQ